MDDKSVTTISRVPPVIWRIVTGFLWLVTSALGILEIWLSNDIALTIYVNFSNQAAPALAMSWVIIFIMSLVMIAYVFGGGEYFWKKAGTQAAWTLLGWVFSIELLILILYFVIR